ncbi:MAG TPA: acyl-CoA synthetase [Acidimicrobiales bacterium]|nr:acyl-CoA synthetase [Acidimicrobiales bacterium]
MSGWNFADVYERVAEAYPDAPSHIQGDRTFTWGQFDRRANALAADFVDAGLTHQSKVAAYLYNGPEYLETYQAAFKAGLAPVNTNYRYGPEEITYLFDNADAEAVVFHASFADLIDGIRPRLPKVKRWYVVADGSPEPDWAAPYESVVAAGADRVVAPWGRSGDDVLLLYTGGTTGMPKGVMWRQDDLFRVLGGGGNPILGEPPREDLDDYTSKLTGPGVRIMPACPLMHGTGQFTTYIAMNGVGCVVTSPSRAFDPAALWDTVQEQQVNALVIVGDAFAKPLLGALNAQPGHWDLSSLLVITSSGVMWSHETKQGLLKHMPSVILFDSLGSSEAVGMAASVSGGGAASETAKFSLGERVKVFTEDGREVQPGSGETGMVAIGGYIPLGYYKDPEKTAKTFREVNGRRYSIPGDWATVGADGSLQLLGRGSVCINTGGEKVYPEEVEEVLKELAEIDDAVCVGLPDERFGEIICAVVQAAPGAEIDESSAIEHVRGRLARYKAPRQVLVVDSIGRSPAGKVDYRGLRDLALQRTGST